MTKYNVTIKELLEAGVHFGHRTHRWCPIMAPYIYGVRNKLHIIDLVQTSVLMNRALAKVSQVISEGGRVLLVGTKPQTRDMVATAANRSAQYYVNHRWLGGMLTNWTTISKSIGHLRDLDALLEGSQEGFTKKELIKLQRKRNKLDAAVGGISGMGGVPDLLFVIDGVREKLAITEANHLGIPVIAVVDTNCDPTGVEFPIPGNDDSLRAVDLYCRLFTKSAIDGLEKLQVSTGADIGERANTNVGGSLAEKVDKKVDHVDESGKTENSENSVAQNENPEVSS